MKKLGVVVPVLNNFKGAVEFFESLYIPSDLHFRPYVIDNWRQNEGVAAAWNKGVERALFDGCDYILISNDDVVMSADVIGELVHFTDVLYDDAVLVTARNVRDWKTADDLRHKWVDAKRVLGDNPDFSCFMITPQTIQEIGYFDTNFWPAYFEDNDYHYRIKLSPYNAYSVWSAEMFHAGSVTQNKDPNAPVVPAWMFEQNRIYYMNKWGSVPGTEKFTTPFNQGGSIRNCDVY